MKRLLHFVLFRWVFRAKSILFALIFGLLGGSFILDTGLFWARSTPDILTVVDLIVLDGDDGPSYIPVYQAMHEGDVIRYSGNSAISPKPHEIGDEVHGYLHPISGEMRSRKELLIWGGGGLAFLAAGIFFGWPSRSQTQGGWLRRQSDPPISTWDDGIDR